MIEKKFKKLEGEIEELKNINKSLNQQVKNLFEKKGGPSEP